MSVSMDEKLYNKIKNSFEQNGGIIASSDDIDRRLDNMNAEMCTFNEKIILIRQKYVPTVSAMFEELIHTAQYRTGRATGSNWIDMEIEAKQKLVKYQNRYGIPNSENEMTLKQLSGLIKLKEGDD